MNSSPKIVKASYIKEKYTMCRRTDVNLDSQKFHGFQKKTVVPERNLLEK